MFNLLWGILFVAVNFALFLLCWRLFGLKGMVAWIGFATVLANIQVVKTIEILGIVTTLGNTMYASISMAVDMLNEKSGVKTARRAVWLGFFTLVSSTLIMQMVLVFEPQATDIAQDSLQTIFGLLPRIAAGSLLAYIISQFLDVRLFAALRQKFPGSRQFWIRTTGSTVVSQLIDSVVFCTIAFAGLYSLNVWLQILLTTYLFKFIISVAATPVLYAARSMKPKEMDA
jgi:hypothetical protein